jgi:hypothetical protein
VRSPILTFKTPPGRAPIALAVGPVSTISPFLEDSAACWNLSARRPPSAASRSSVPTRVSALLPLGPTTTIRCSRIGAVAWTPAILATLSAVASSKPSVDLAASSSVARPATPRVICWKEPITLLLDTCTVNSSATPAATPSMAISSRRGCTRSWRV